MNHARTEANALVTMNAYVRLLSAVRDANTVNIIRILNNDSGSGYD